MIFFQFFPDSIDNIIKRCASIIGHDHPRGLMVSITTRKQNLAHALLLSDSLMFTPCGSDGNLLSAHPIKMFRTCRSALMEAKKIQDPTDNLGESIRDKVRIIGPFDFKDIIGQL